MSHLESSSQQEYLLSLCKTYLKEGDAFVFRKDAQELHITQEAGEHDESRQTDLYYALKYKLTPGDTLRVSLRQGEPVLDVGADAGVQAGLVVQTPDVQASVASGGVSLQMGGSVGLAGRVSVKKVPAPAPPVAADEELPFSTSPRSEVDDSHTNEDDRSHDTESVQVKYLVSDQEQPTSAAALPQAKANHRARGVAADISGRRFAKGKERIAQELGEVLSSDDAMRARVIEPLSPSAQAGPMSSSMRADLLAYQEAFAAHNKSSILWMIGLGCGVAWWLNGAWLPPFFGHSLVQFFANSAFAGLWVIVVLWILMSNLDIGGHGKAKAELRQAQREAWVPLAQSGKINEERLTRWLSDEELTAIKSEAAKLMPSQLHSKAPDTYAALFHLDREMKELQRDPLFWGKWTIPALLCVLVSLYDSAQGVKFTGFEYYVLFGIFFALVVAAQRYWYHLPHERALIQSHLDLIAEARERFGMDNQELAIALQGDPHLAAIYLPPRIKELDTLSS